MIPIHRWVRPFGTHLNDLTDGLPPSHFPTQPALPTRTPSRELRQYACPLPRRMGEERRSGAPKWAPDIGSSHEPDVSHAVEGLR